MEVQRFIGKIKRVSGNEVTFTLDNGIDLTSLSRLSDGNLPTAEVVFRDQRMITPEQRKKAWALIHDVSRYTGYDPMDSQMWLKTYFMADTGSEYFSLSNCNVELARSFISYIIEFCFKFNIPFKDKGITLTDDASRFFWLCIKYRKCAICGLHADIHHVDTVGMGNDRRKVDHGERRMIALCRNHHQEVDRIGQETFDRLHQVQGIRLNDKDLVAFRITTKENVENHKIERGREIWRK